MGVQLFKPPLWPQPSSWAGARTDLPQVADLPLHRTSEHRSLISARNLAVTHPVYTSKSWWTGHPMFCVSRPWPEFGWRSRIQSAPDDFVPGTVPLMPKTLVMRCPWSFFTRYGAPENIWLQFLPKIFKISSLCIHIPKTIVGKVSFDVIFCTLAIWTAVSAWGWLQIDKNVNHF